MNCESPAHDRSELRVALALRHRGPFRSIEEVFDRICPCLPKGIRADRLAAPASGVAANAVLKNVRWLRGLAGYDVVHVTGDIHYALCASSSRNTVLTIHDLRCVDESRGLRRLALLWFWFVLPSRFAKRITAISETTKRRLVALTGVDTSKVRVIPNCVSMEWKPSKKTWDALDVRVLIVGTTPNKNLERIAMACEGLGLRVSVLGRLDEGQIERFRHHKLSVRDHFDLQQSDVARLYAESDLVVFPSLYEGFGMPIVEAQAIGRPVLTSNVSPMREVAGRGALLVDPTSASSIREGMQSLLSDPVLRAALVEEGFQNVRRYSAEAVAAEYAAVYREVASTG